MPKVTFQPDDKEVKVKRNESILSAALMADIYIESVCGGIGQCGKCKVIVEGKTRDEHTELLTEDELEKGYKLACQTYPLDDVVVLVPEASRVGLHQILTKTELTHLKKLDPRTSKLVLELPAPTLSDNVSDVTRIERALHDMGIRKFAVDLRALKKLSKTLRKSDWHVTLTLMALNNGVHELVAIEPGNRADRHFSVAVDVGTTTVVAELIELNTGRVLDSAADYNKQVICGEDVLSRILFTEEEHGLSRLNNLIIETVNYLIRELCINNDVRRNELVHAAFAGNTTMTQLLLGLDPTYIRREPYVPTTNFVPYIKAHDLRLRINPNAHVYVLPCRSSYVGGDITADILASKLHRSQAISMLIDVGTNGEVVLGNRDWMVSCSCSAGPAFEGGEVDFGIRATKGAIEKLSLTPGLDVSYSTIGGGKPKGICGSGLIDLLAELFTHRVIDRSGAIQSRATPRIRDGHEGTEFVFVWARDNVIGKDMTISEVDIRNIIRTKAAVYASCTVLLKALGYGFDDVSTIFIAGGFGNYLNVNKAVLLGLLPDVPLGRFKFIGNGALTGARLVLLSERRRREAEQITRKLTYIELSVDPLFFNEFTSALFLPHTDIERFPTVKRLMIEGGEGLGV